MFSVISNALLNNIVCNYSMIYVKLPTQLGNVVRATEVDIFVFVYAEIPREQFSRKILVDEETALVEF